MGGFEDLVGGLLEGLADTSGWVLVGGSLVEDLVELSLIVSEEVSKLYLHWGNLGGLQKLVQGDLQAGLLAGLLAGLQAGLQISLQGGLQVW